MWYPWNRRNINQEQLILQIEGGKNRWVWGTVLAATQREVGALPRPIAQPGQPSGHTPGSGCSPCRPRLLPALLLLCDFEQGAWPL